MIYLICKKFLFIIATLVIFAMPVNAYADKYKIEIHQINPDGWTYNGTCNAVENELCHVFMGINPQNEQNVNDIELDVGLHFQKNSAYFQFKSGAEYFFLANDNTIHRMPLKEDNDTILEKVSIYRRSPAAKNEPVNSLNVPLVMRPPPELVAELEVTIIPVAEK